MQHLHSIIVLIKLGNALSSVTGFIRFTFHYSTNQIVLGLGNTPSEKKFTFHYSTNQIRYIKRIVISIYTNIIIVELYLVVIVFII